MGVSRSPQELALKLDRYAVRVGRINRTAIEAAALAVKRETEPLVRQATGGDMKLSGVGKRGAKVGVRYDVRGNDNATAIVKATGPAQLVERDVKPHPVVSKYAPSRTRKGRQALAGSPRAIGAGWNPRAVISFGGITVRYAVNSGGSKGRKPYEKGFAKGAEVAPKVYAQKQSEVMRSVFL